MSPAPIEFWFDLTSPYAYFAGLEVDALAARHGRTVHWKPFLLGVIFKTTGSSPLTAQPLKGDYARRDWARLARLAGVAFTLRDDFPLRTQVPARMVLALEAEAGIIAAGKVAKRLLDALFGEGADIANVEIAAALASGMGFDRSSLIAASGDLHWREALQRRCAEAEERGICGSPWIVIGDEPFWGADRLEMAERWLTTGGW